MGIDRFLKNVMMEIQEMAMAAAAGAPLRNFTTAKEDLITTSWYLIIPAVMCLVKTALYLGQIHA